MIFKWSYLLEVMENIMIFVMYLSYILGCLSIVNNTCRVGPNIHTFEAWVKDGLFFFIHSPLHCC